MNALNPSAFDDSVHEHNDAQGCRELMQAVLHRAFIDATYDGPQRYEQQAQRDAHSWITNCGRDFRQVCDLAGMGADFLSEAYKSGRVDRSLLKGSEVSQAKADLVRGKVSQLVLDAIRGEMTTSEISDAFKAEGSAITPKQARNNLFGSLRRTGKVTGRQEGGVMYWSIPRDHVSCKDRIAAAKREAAK